MTFWKLNKETKKHEWISHPEKQARTLLSTWLSSRFGHDIYTFEEISSGAGRIDIFVISPAGEKAIIELKMCGNRYSLKYAIEGIEQLEHYMKNKKTQTGYLVVFDSRTRDYSKGFGQRQIMINDMTISTAIVDVRPKVKNK